MRTLYISCSVCGVFFSTAGSASKYCSQACRRKHKADMKHLMKACVQCGEKFDVENSKRRYCSEGCKGDAAHARMMSRMAERCECGKRAVEKQGGTWLCRACLCADVVSYREYWLGLASNLASISGRDTLSFHCAGVNA